MSIPLLSVRGLTCRRDNGDGSAILHELDLDVHEGEVVVLRGPSGCGKTTLLKCLAELNVYQSGDVRLRGKLATEYGIPRYRTLVQYVPQRPALLPGTPLDFLARIRSFASRRQSASEHSTSTSASTSPQLRDPVDPLDLAGEWGVETVLWTREWGSLSGGESQRIALAIAVGIGGAEVLLLDEPTSALDSVSMRRVEDSLLAMLPPLKTRPSEANGVRRRGTGPKALVWITHEAAQAERVGTRFVDLGSR